MAAAVLPPLQGTKTKFRPMLVWLVQQWVVARRERGKKWRRTRERLTRWKAERAAASGSALEP